MQSIDTNKIEKLSNNLRKAESEKKGVEPLTELDSNISIEEAYKIQMLTIQNKIKAGQKIVGKKIGLTSVAMQKLLGVDQPDYGHLLDGMAIENYGVITRDKVLQPKVEAEIAFVLKKDLIGPSVTVMDVIQATDYVIPSLEIVDSRVADWKIQLQDTIADNASSGLYVLGGKPMLIDQVDLAQIGMVLYKNGEIMNTGVGAAALGHPAVCVAWLANQLHQFGHHLKAGEVILSGALSAAIDAKPGDFFHARFAHIGDVGVRFS